MLELPTFVSWLHLQYNVSHVIKFVVDVMDRNYDVITFISEFLSKRRPIVANFVEIIKIETIFIKRTFKNSKMLKELEIMY